MSNFWRSFDLPLINWEIELDLLWLRYCVVSEISRTAAMAQNPLVVGTATTSARFRINKTKFYVPVVTLSINNNTRFLEKIKQGFKRMISWKKYRPEITRQPIDNNLNYLIDPTFRNINRLFAISVKNGNNNLTRNYFDNITCH